MVYTSVSVNIPLRKIQENKTKVISMGQRETIQEALTFERYSTINKESTEQVEPLGALAIETVVETPDTSPTEIKVTIDPKWRKKGHCKDAHPSTMFPDRVQAAKRIIKKYCEGGGDNVCPVKSDCLEDALLEGKQFGVRGGMTHTERKNLIKSRLAAKN